MRCPKCGMEIAQGMTFCTQCGTKMSPWKTEPLIISEKKPHKHTKPRLWLILGAAGVLIVAIACVFLLLFNSEINRFERAVERQDISEALRYYQELDFKERAKAKTWLREYIEEVEADYYAEKIDFTSAAATLRGLYRFEAVYEEAQRAVSRLETDNSYTVFFAQAQDCAREEDWENAYRALVKIGVEYRNYKEALALRDECAQNYRSAVLERCEKLSESEDFRPIFEALSKALQLLPEDTELLTARSRYADRLEASALAEAEKLAQNGDYEGAVRVLEEAVAIWPSDSLQAETARYQDAATQMKIQAVRDECERLLRESGAESALRYLDSDEIRTICGNRYGSIFGEYRGKFVDEMLAKAAVLAEQRKYAEAIKLLEEAYDKYESAQLLGQIQEYTKYLPIDLADCHVLEKNNIRIGNITDNFGKNYKNAICNSSYAYSAYAVFYTNRRYQTLKGTIAPSSDCYRGHKGVIRIYADGVEIFNSGKITTTTEPFTFELNVNGCKQLRIVFEIENAGWEAILSAKLS